MTFLSTVSFRANKFLLTVGALVDIFVDCGFQSNQNPVNIKSWHFCSFQSYLTPARCSASRQLNELTTENFRATWIMKALCCPFTERVGNGSFTSYLRKLKTRRFLSTVWFENRSFQRYFKNCYFENYCNLFLRF